jgi:hypothetical protein
MTKITKRWEMTVICLKKLLQSPCKPLERKQGSRVKLNSKIKKHTDKASPYIPRRVQEIRRKEIKWNVFGGRVRTFLHS